MLRVHRPVCSLLFLVAALAPAAEDLGRDLREQELNQRAIATSTTGSVDQLREIIESLRCNGLADPADEKRLAELTAKLTTLSNQGATDTSTGPNMHAAADALAKAQQTKARDDLAGAVSQTKALASSLTTLLDQVNSGKGALGSQIEQLIAQQQKLLGTTQEFADKTLGKEDGELSTGERQQKDRLAERQKALAKALQDLGQKPDSPPGQAVAQREATAASQRLSENHLAEAQERQEKVLAALKDAAKASEGAQTPAVDGTAAEQQQAQLQKAMAQLDQQMAAMAATAQAQQQNLDATQKASPTDQAAMNQAQAAQADIANQLAQQASEQSPQSQQAAQQAAQQAQAAKSALAQMSQAQAAQAMQAALSQMAQAQLAMAQQMAGMQQQMAAMQPSQTPGQPQENSPPTSGKTADSNKTENKALTRHRDGIWQVTGDAGDRETLTQSAGETFPARYERQLTGYYQQLADGGRQ